MSEAGTTEYIEALVEPNEPITEATLKPIAEITLEPDKESRVSAPNLSDSPEDDYKDPRRRTQDFTIKQGHGGITRVKDAHTGQHRSGRSERDVLGTTGTTPPQWFGGSYGETTEPDEYPKLRYLTDKEAIKLSQQGKPDIESAPIKAKHPITSDRNGVTYSTDSEEHRYYYPETPLELPDDISVYTGAIVDTGHFSSKPVLLDPDEIKKAKDEKNFGRKWR